VISICLDRFICHLFRHPGAVRTYELDPYLIQDRGWKLEVARWVVARIENRFGASTSGPEVLNNASNPPSQFDIAISSRRLWRERSASSIEVVRLTGVAGWKDGVTTSSSSATATPPKPRKCLWNFSACAVTPKAATVITTSGSAKFSKSNAGGIEQLRTVKSRKKKTTMPPQHRTSSTFTRRFRPKASDGPDYLRLLQFLDHGVGPKSEIQGQEQTHHQARFARLVAADHNVWPIVAKALRNRIHFWRRRAKVVRAFPVRRRVRVGHVRWHERAVGRVGRRRLPCRDVRRAVDAVAGQRPPWSGCCWRCWRRSACRCGIRPRWA